ncbi:MAG: NAD-dependent epimerase/dehydratase family protein [Solirubrobacteraceae bacterium]
MRIFVTGGTGYIGSEVVRQLVARGDEVRALARSDGSMQKAEGLGAVPVRGELGDTDLLRAEAEVADAVIHLGSPTGTGDEAAITRAAADALKVATPYLHTGGIWSFGNTHGGADETHALHPPALTAWRTAIEEDVLAGPHGVVVMLAVVYGGGGGILPGVFGEGRYVGNGEYHVALVHLEDVAALYVRALDAPAGTRVAGVTQCVQAREIAAALSGGHTTSETLHDAEARLGHEFAEAMTLDQRVTAVRARELGWAPEHRDAVAALARR